MRQRLYIAGLFGGVAVLVLLAVLISGFGRKHPSPPWLADAPNAAIRGELVFVDKDGCFVRAAASGASRETVYCVGGAKGGPVTWIDANTIGYVDYRGAAGATLVAIDLTTKKERDTGQTVDFKGGPGSTESVRGERVDTDQEGRVFRITDGVRTEIADFDVPEYSGPTAVTWSPDGDWILLAYHGRNSDGGELWIVSRDGATRGTIARGLQGTWASWRIDGVGISPTLVAR